MTATVAPPPRPFNFPARRPPLALAPCSGSIGRMVDAASVESWLAAQGRPCERIDPATWRSAFHGAARSFRFFVRLTEDWIFFTIAPFVVAPRSPAAERQLHRHLLR